MESVTECVIAVFMQSANVQLHTACRQLMVTVLQFVLQTLCFSMSGENLTLNLRDQAFKAMLRQEIGWFDEVTNSTGALTNILSDDTRNAQGVSHHIWLEFSS